MSNPNDKNADAILRQNAERHVNRGNIQSHQIDKVVAAAHRLWVGAEGNGPAVDKAVKLVKDGVL